LKTNSFSVPHLYFIHIWRCTTPSKICNRFWCEKVCWTSF